MLRVLETVVAILSLLGQGVLGNKGNSPPKATVKNGTLVGKYVASYDQDLFLGIPYAQPPVGPLRLNNPQSLNTSFGTRQAVDYADSCVGYGNSPAWPFTLSEDCLTLNIVRPAGVAAGAKLPVGVFIHGGGWVMDYSANGVYNLSFMVQESVKAKKPIIAVSLDYRLSAWGFLASQDILDAGVSNLGLKDQRLALHYIRENIAAFGGDPDKVVIWGESAGGGNVGYQATAFGGRDDGLFRGLISESGAEGTQLKNLTVPNAIYNNITRFVGCDTKPDKLACLRTVSFDSLNWAITNLTVSSFHPVVDGDFVSDYSSTLLRQGKFTKTPFLIGTNADEGTGFVSSTTSSDAEIRALISGSGPDDNTTTILMELYPNIDALGLPSTFFNTPGLGVGSQFKRAAAIATDQSFLAWKRVRAAAWSKANVPTYAYLFESPLTAFGALSGTPHFTEIGYVFYNTINLGYAAGVSPLANATQPVLDLAKLVSRMWISFIHDLDPNNHGLSHIQPWPMYNNTGGYGMNFYFNPNGSSPQPDTFRLAGTAFMNAVAAQQYGQ